MTIEHVTALASWQEQIEDLSLFGRRSPVPLGREALEATWREILSGSEPRQSYWFAIVDEEGDPAGIGGLQLIDYANGDATLPLFLASRWRRKGIGLRAAALLLDLAFDQLRLHRVSSMYRDDNEGSRSLADSAGFTLEGRVRQGWYAGGRHVDVVLVGILADEWRDARARLSATLDPDPVVAFGNDPAAAWSFPPAREASA